LKGTKNRHRHVLAVDIMHHHHHQMHSKLDIGLGWEKEKAESIKA
jgi:hypothetical protein